jgi:glycosyltransferase involved in cell wall biosynthesis
MRAEDHKPIFRGDSRILYITYDGLLEPLGQSQVFQYLKRLAPGREICILSFEKPDDLKDTERRSRVAQEARQSKIKWIPLRYHSRPTVLATAFDIACGVMVAAWLRIRYGVRVVHARSYVPALIALALKRAFHCRFIFDMRGFWADERLEAQQWTADSMMYRLVKRCEASFLGSAEAIVSLTEAGEREIRNFAYLRDRELNLHVIPTCTNLEMFRLIEPTQPGINTRFTLGYVGCASARYAFDAVMQYFKILRSIRHDARMLVVNRGDHDYIRAMLIRHDIPPDAVELKSSNFEQMALEMSRMDAAVFFAEPTYAKRAMSPTRFGEFLACGLPCVTNSGIGDVKSIVENERVGVVLRDLSQEELRRGVEGILQLAITPGIRGRCRAAAVKRYSLDQGVSAYAQIYDSLFA